jgi:hypothetical protein
MSVVAPSCALISIPPNLARWCHRPVLPLHRTLPGGAIAPCSHSTEPCQVVPSPPLVGHNVGISESRTRELANSRSLSHGVDVFLAACFYF